MNVLVTGSNGLVGSWIVKELKKNHTVIGSGTKEKSTSDVDWYIRWDIGHEDIPASLLRLKIDAVVHAASNKSVNDDDLELSFANLVGTHRVINLCRIQKCKVAILFSGISFIENPHNGKICETGIVNPRTMYLATKAAQELMFQQLERDGIRVVTLRIPSPVAPIMKGRTIFTIFTERAINDEDIVINGRGTRRQNYIDVRDIAQAVERIFCSANAKGVYNMASEVTVSNLELAKKCIEIAGSKSKIIYSGKSDPTDNQIWDIEISKLKEDTGFKQEYKIEQTICEYIEIYRKNHH